MDQQDRQSSDQADEENQEDSERQRIHQGHENVEPEPGVTAALNQVTEEEKREEPTGVMPGAGPDEEPGPDRERVDSDSGAGDHEGQDGK